MEDNKNVDLKELLKMAEDNYRGKMRLPDEYKFLNNDEIIKELFKILDDEKMIACPNMDTAAFLTSLLCQQKDELDKRIIRRFELISNMSPDGMYVIIQPVFGSTNEETITKISEDVIHATNIQILFEQFKINLHEILENKKSEETTEL